MSSTPFPRVLGATPGEVFERLGQVEKQLRQIQRQTFSQTGLTPQQFFVLHTLRAQDGQPLKDLAVAAHCTRATMTSLVDGLETKGLAVRSPNPADRRSVLVSLTRTGRAKLRGAPSSLEGTYCHCCSGLSAQEFGMLHGLLGKLQASLSGESCPK